MQKLLIVACLAAVTALLSAQQPLPGDPVSFEVATVKQNKSGERGGGIRRLPGGA